jgi:hypothetical protein
MTDGPNVYLYCNNDPVNWIDPYGLDAKTFGPFTIYYNKKDLAPGEQAAERAHEQQHQKDWTKFTTPGWKKEQNAFAAEMPVLQKHIADLLNIQCSRSLTEAEKNDLSMSRTALKVAETIAGNEGAAKDYWNQIHPLPWHKVK